MFFFKKLGVYFKKHKKEILVSVWWSFLFFFIAIAIVGFKILYPYHLIIALPFLVLSLRNIFKLFITWKDTLTHTTPYTRFKKICSRFEKLFLFFLFLGIAWYVLAQILPSDIHPYKDMTDTEITEFVDQSLDVSILYIDQLEILGDALVESNLLDTTELSADELSRLKMMWDEFLSAAQGSEEITDIHRYFGQISYFDLPETHTKSFVISYALYLKKFEMFGRIIERVGGNKRVIKALNEDSPVFGGKNSFYDIRDRHVGHSTFLRRNLGRAYIFFLEKTVDTASFGEDYLSLIRASKESYRYLFSSTFDTTETIARKYSDDVENGLFNSWFPVQMNVADAMGKINVSKRHVNFVTREQVLTMKKELAPGDIFVERRNWHLSNVGIPGFWPHAALYLGTREETDAYFNDLFPREGYANFTELIRDRYPTFYGTYTGADENSYPYAVIEGQAPGIILQSLEKSAMADYVAALRPRLTKEEKLIALLRAIGNYGKPYDYNFDFETRDEIVCSELVYDAYLPAASSTGLSFELTMTSGRKMISPNAMVEKFYNEYGTENQELDFVYFLDGNEDLQKAFPKDVNTFLTSWTRSKFSQLQE